MGLTVDIKKSFGAFTLQAQFEAQEGVLGILGASGSGKSVTLRCIAGILTPDEGHIELDGQVLFDSAKGIDLKPQQRRVGLLFQNYALFPNMTILQNLMAPLKAAHVERRAAAKQAMEMLARFYLEGLEDLKPHQLSGGQQQRAALARILLSEPKLLMLDEPFSALDEYLRWQMELELKQVIAGYGSPALLVSHSRGEIYRMCDRICVMDAGQTAPAAPVHALFEKPGTRAGALLSGCKNYAAVGESRGTLYEAKEWGMMLESEAKAPEALRWIGVRSHYVRPVTEGDERTLPNVIPCVVTDVVEDVFSMVVMLRPEEGTERIRMDLSKEAWRALCLQSGGATPEKLRVWVHPHDVMLLS